MLMKLTPWNDEFAGTSKRTSRGPFVSSLEVWSEHETKTGTVQNSNFSFFQWQAYSFCSLFTLDVAT